MQNSEIFIDHEVRMRLIETAVINMNNNFEKVDNKFDKLESKIDSQFHWVLGTILAQIALITTLFGGIILHLAKLV